MTDCHLHLVDFLQRTDGARAALKAMDQCGVEEAVVSGMPVVKEWPQQEKSRPEYYLDDDSRCYWYSATDVLVAREIQSLSAGQQKRFHPTICGFNGADRNALDHIERMIDWYPGFWQGIGEVMTRHDDLTALTYGTPARADKLALSRVFAFAGKHDLPIFLHSNAGSVWKREPIYLNEVETAVREHPGTRFVWCHAGISRRIEIPTLTQELSRMLGKYPNLHIDVSWVVYETNLLAVDGKPSSRWVALIEAYPDRFLIGSDKVGHFADYPREITKYFTFLDALKPQTARKLARENLLAILPKSAARLTEQESDILNGRQSPGTELLKEAEARPAR
ncbi:MAG TPA: amidohydrolase family protein [Tepidisphaeraceae bacterium]|nr:amidohydrolase family protein [Tepidisphaeraceae bacterium]